MAINIDYMQIITIALGIVLIASPGLLLLLVLRILTMPLRKGKNRKDSEK